MIFSFDNFRFDSERLILTKDGTILTLNEKPAQLLRLLLNNPDKILDKSEILEHVWSGKFTSEQVVFQNISYLRVLFGHDAIKTFVKKGYQWQLPVTKDNTESTVPGSPNSVDSMDLSALAISSTPNREPITKNLESNQLNSNLANDKLSADTETESSFRKAFTSLLFVIAVLLIYGGWLAWQAYTILPKNKLVTLTFEQDSKFSKQIATPNRLFSIKFIDDHKLNQRLFDSPFTTWKMLTTEPETLVIGGRLYRVNNGDVLRFHIQGKHRGWQGYLYSKTTAELEKQLNQLLTALADTDYFAVKSEPIALAKLTILNNLHPNNLLISYQLMQLNYELGYLDRALALIDTQLNADISSVDIGLLNLLKAKVILRKTNWRTALAFLTSARKIFSELNLSHLESQALLEEAKYQLNNRNHTKAMQALNLSVANAREAQEPLLEVLAHRNQAYYAAKNNKETLMTNELDLARQLLKVYALGDEHRIPIMYTEANISSQDEKLSRYSAIIDQPFSPLYSRMFYFSAKKVREAYIAKQLWAQADASIKPWQRQSFVNLSRAHIAFAKKDWQKGLTQAVQAFRQGQIESSTRDALDAALLLVQVAELNASVGSTSEYADFINQNAYPVWSRSNKSALEKLGLNKRLVDN